MATGYQEVLTSSIGSFGVAQFWISAASIAPKITAAISMIMIGFSSSEPKWYRENVVFNQTTNSTIVNQYAKSCTFGVNDTLNYNTPFETIVTEWRLICDESFIPTTIQTTQMVGVLFGSASFGQLGDLIGRKYCLQISQLLQIIALLVQGLSYNWYMFICSSFLLGLGAGGFLVVTNIYMLEFIGTKWRTLCATFPAWGMGVILFGALIKALPNWRHMCYLAAALNVPMVCISLFTPRSPRWLFTHGRAEQGKEALVKLAKQNKNETPDFVHLEKLIDEETRKEKQSGSYTYMSLFKLSSTRKKTLLLSYVWFCCGFSYYGLTLGIGTLSGDMAINYMFMGIGELLITLVVIGSAKLFGRKYGSIILFVLSFLTSFSITISYFTTSDETFQSVMNWLALLSRFFLAAAWGQVIVYTAEIYPTVIRSVGYGFVSVIARIGGIVAPQNKALFNQSQHLPFTINGVLILISSLVILMLPETMNSPMADYIGENEEGEACNVESNKRSNQVIPLNEKTPISDDAKSD